MAGHREPRCHLVAPQQVGPPIRGFFQEHIEPRRRGAHIGGRTEYDSWGGVQSLPIGLCDRCDIDQARIVYGLRKRSGQKCCVTRARKVSNANGVRHGGDCGVSQNCGQADGLGVGGETP